MEKKGWDYSIKKANEKGLYGGWSNHGRYYYHPNYLEYDRLL